MEVKPGYKQTEVGVIPEEWDVKNFGQICRVNQGLQIAIERRLKHPTSTAKSYITIQYLNDSKQAEYIDDYPLSACCSPDDVLMTRTGNTGIVVSGVEGVFHNNFFKINFDRKVLNREFLIGFLGLSSTRRTILIKAGTSTIPDLNHGDFYSISLPIPALPEQRAIATALSDVDGLLGGLDRLIAKKRDLKQAAMQQLLTGQTRLPGFCEQWQTQCLNNVAERSAGFWGVAESDAGHPKQVQVVRAGDISPDGHLTATAPRFFSDSECAKALCELDDVVLTGSGSVGKVWWCDGRKDIAASNFVRVLRPKRHRANGRFLSELLRSEFSQREMIEHIATGVMANLGSSFFSKNWVKLPPIPEQTAIAEVLTEMDLELAGLEQRREKTRALKRAMMQELLTGKTRLVAPQNPELKP